ncbi:MAG: hypothetical protein H0V19_09845, partial [Euzebyales bacterium]|nr:hypothetical protein [Euzebyales bacterium]
QTLRRAADAGLRVRLLEPRHDLDTAADLLAALRRGQLAGAPRTATLVRRLVDRLGPEAVSRSAKAG